MASNNGTRSPIQQILIGAAILAAVVVPLSGLQLQISANQSDVADLEARVERLNENLALLDVLDIRIHQVEGEVTRIERTRDDIIQAICAATARDGRTYDRCIRATSNGSSPG